MSIRQISLQNAARALIPHRRFAVLLLLFIVGGLLQQITLPAMEGYDETLHYNYVTHLRAVGSLPDRSADQSNGTRQESGQPPLTYWAMATFMNVLHVPPEVQDPLYELDNVRNLWFTPIDPWRREDNGNVYFDGADGNLIAHSEVAAADRVARLVSLLFGVIAVIGAYGALREVFTQDRWVVLGTALFAFTPQIFQLSAVVSNDAGAMAFATLTIWQTLRLLRKGASPQRLIGIGVLLGLTGLSKVNALLIAPSIAAALVIDWRSRHTSVRDLVRNGILVALPFAVLFGTWVLYGWVNYRSPFGLEGHSIFADPHQGIPRLDDFISALAAFYMSYLAKLGAGGMWLEPLLYALLTVITVAAVLGYVLWLLSRPKLNSRSLYVQQGLVLGIVALSLFAGLFYWLVQLFAINQGIQGRLIYPGHAAFVIILTGGLRLVSLRLNEPLRKLLRVYVISLLIATSLILTPLVQTASYALPRMLTEAQLPTLQGTPFDYEHTIRFLGYQQRTPLIHAGQIQTFTLCWRVLGQPTRPAAFSLKLFDANGTSFGDRTSVHGLGHYPSAVWRVGDTFCDEVDMSVSPTLPEKQRFQLLLVVLDAQTMAVNWQATAPANTTPVQYPIIGQVNS